MRWGAVRAMQGGARCPCAESSSGNSGHSSVQTESSAQDRSAPRVSDSVACFSPLLLTADSLRTSPLAQSAQRAATAMQVEMASRGGGAKATATTTTIAVTPAAASDDTLPPVGLGIDLSRTASSSRASVIASQQSGPSTVFVRSRAAHHVAFDLPSVKTKKRSDFILLPNGPKRWWDLLVVLLVIYLAGMLPVILCFNISNSRLDSFQIFVDTVFYVDVVLYFFTAYGQRQRDGRQLQWGAERDVGVRSLLMLASSRSLTLSASVLFALLVLSTLSPPLSEKGGVTIFSHKRIAAHYLRGWFFIDLIACLPWEEMSRVVSSGAAGSVFVKILKSCKALRLLRLSRLFKFLERQQLVGHVMRMLRMLFFFFLFAHWVACLWYALGAYYFTHSQGVDGWLPACAPPLDPNSSPFSDLYVTSLYWVLTTWVTVGYGDVLPRTDLEKCFAMSVMVVGAVVYATIFGNVAILLQSLGRLDTIFKTKMETVNFYMDELDLPPAMQVRVRNYYTFLWARHKSFSSSNQLEELPPSLTNQIAQSVGNSTCRNETERKMHVCVTRLWFERVAK